MFLDNAYKEYNETVKELEIVYLYFAKFFDSVPQIVLIPYPSREQKLILQDLARILQKKINLARSCKTELILQDLARRS